MEEVQQLAEAMETKYHDTAGQLDMVRADLEEALRKNQALEKKLQASLLNQVCGKASPAVEPLMHHFAKGLKYKQYAVKHNSINDFIEVYFVHCDMFWL
jgi:hypothetical protein